jgi:hypothetical protein
MQKPGFKFRQNPPGNCAGHKDTGAGFFRDYCLFSIGVTPPLLRYIILEIDSVIKYNK